MNGMDEKLWRDGALWWPTESADGRWRFLGERLDGRNWISKRPGFRVLRVLSWVWLAASPVVYFVGFAYIASDPSYVGEPEPPYRGAVAILYLLWVPIGLLGLFLTNRILGRPGLAGRGRRAARWVWTPPACWPTPPPGWVPTSGWQPDPSWPAAPADWRGWLLEQPGVSRATSPPHGQTQRRS